LFYRMKLSRVIRKAIRKTRKEFLSAVPKISTTDYYGAYYITPHALVIWYIFGSIEDEELAKRNGLEGKISTFTRDSLIAGGYPVEAFEDKTVGHLKTVVQSNENVESVEIQEPLIRKVHISFTSLEDIEIKANGDWRMYFQ
jgi:hypothetical protein